MIVVDDVHKYFGGFRAVDGASLTIDGLTVQIVAGQAWVLNGTDSDCDRGCQWDWLVYCP